MTMPGFQSNLISSLGYKGRLLSNEEFQLQGIKVIDSPNGIPGHPDQTDTFINIKTKKPLTIDETYLLYAQRTSAPVEEWLNYQMAFSNLRLPITGKKEVIPPYAQSALDLATHMLLNRLDRENDGWFQSSQIFAEKRKPKMEHTSFIVSSFLSILKHFGAELTCNARIKSSTASAPLTVECVRKR